MVMIKMVTLINSNFFSLSSNIETLDEAVNA